MVERITRCLRDSDWRCKVVRIAGLALALMLVVYAKLALTNAGAPVSLVVYAFSSQEEMLTQRIFPEFERAWEAQCGCDLEIEGVFGPSGTLAGQINLGAPADVALFSNAQNVAHLKVGRQVEPETESPVYGHTPMVIATRRGNPSGIAAFADLARSQPPLHLVHADPLTSGAGQWAVFAEYGSALLDDGGDPAAAEARLQSTWQNVQLLGASARAAMTLFELGAGDALVTYEQEALLARERNVPLEIVVPARTIVAEHVAVIVDRNVMPGEEPVAEAFIAYLLSDAGQQSLRRFHLRPGPLAGDDRAGMPQAFTVEDLGGWPRAYRELIDTLWRTEVEPRLDLEPTPRLLDGGE